MLEPHLKGAEDTVHCDEVHLHNRPLLLAQVALDLVQHTAQTQDTMKDPGLLSSTDAPVVPLNGKDFPILSQNDSGRQFIGGDYNTGPCCAT